MAETTTRLLPLKNGRRWRVQISWPNGTTRSFGKFRSEPEALEWIATHRSLTEHVMVKTDIYRKRTKKLKPPSGDAIEKKQIGSRTLNQGPTEDRDRPEKMPEGADALFQTVGKNIRRWRVAAGFSLVALAERSKMDHRYLSQIELGRQNLTIKTLWKIATALEVRASQLLHQPLIEP